MTTPNEKRYKVGDVVALASGGPEMTITSVKYSGESTEQARIFCAWFGSENKIQEANFPHQCLIPPAEKLRQKEAEENGEK